MNYIQLNEIIFNQPLSTLTAVIIVASFIISGYKLGGMILGSENIYSTIFGYIFIILSLSVIVNTLISFRINNILYVRVFILMISLYGIISIIALRAMIYNALKRAVCYYSDFNLFEKLTCGLIFFHMLALLLNSFGPPTDADSLDYHLGIPLLWFRNLSAFPLDGWLQTRLVGLGEVINYIGLVCGTDILGQIIQYSGLWIIFISLLRLSKNKHILLFGLLVFCIPLNISLVTSQKPFLFPSAVMFYGFALFLHNIGNHEKKTFFISIPCICYGIACKYSFIISGSILIIFIMITAIRKKSFLSLFITCIISALIIIAPIYIRNYIYFGDPITPMLEYLKADPNPLIVRFAESLKSYGGEINIYNVAILPITLGITFDISLISTVLGIGTFSFFFTRLNNYEAKIMLFLALAICGSVLLIGNISPRYYLDVYWLVLGSLCYSKLNQNIFYFRTILLVQAALFSLISTFGLIFLFPGSLSASYRDKVMAKSAVGYEESKWLDNKLPDDAYILAQVRSKALLPRRFVPWDQFFWGNKQEDVNKYLKSNNNDGITALLLKLPLHENLNWLNKYSNNSLKNTFIKGTRNPFNRGDPYEMQLFILSGSKP